MSSRKSIRLVHLEHSSKLIEMLINSNKFCSGFFLKDSQFFSDFIKIFAIHTHISFLSCFIEFSVKYLWCSLSFCTFKYRIILLPSHLSSSVLSIHSTAKSIVLHHTRIKESTLTLKQLIESVIERERERTDLKIYTQRYTKT